MKNSDTKKEQNIKLNVGYNRIALRKDSVPVQYINSSSKYRDKFMCFLTGKQLKYLYISVSYTIVSIYVHIQMYVYNIFKFIHTYVYVCMYVCMYQYVPMYTHALTYT
jgi:hypothetical protein